MPKTFKRPICLYTYFIHQLLSTMCTYTCTEWHVMKCHARNAHIAVHIVLPHVEFAHIVTRVFYLNYYSSIWCWQVKVKCIFHCRDTSLVPLKCFPQMSTHYPCYAMYYKSLNVMFKWAYIKAIQKTTSIRVSFSM